MSAERLFGLCNMVALAGWIVLVAAPRRAWAAPLVAGVVIPSLLACVYAGLIVTSFGRAEGGFSTLAAVARLFENPWLLLAGWVHYLTFDLFIGAWEARDAARRDVPHALLVPCLALTFLFGPIGLLAYLALRFWRARQLSAAE